MHWQTFLWIVKGKDSNWINVWWWWWWKRRRYCFWLLTQVYSCIVKVWTPLHWCHMSAHGLLRPNKTKYQLIFPARILFLLFCYFLIVVIFLISFLRHLFKSTGLGATSKSNVMLSNMCNRLFHKTIIVSATSKSFNISDPVNTNTVAVLTGPHATNRYKISLQRVQTEDLVACLIWNTKRTILIKKIINSKALILLFFEKSGRSTCIFFYLA